MASPGEEALRPPRDVSDIEELLNSVTDQISIWDHDQRLIYANPSILHWMGDELSRLRGSRFTDIVGSDVTEHLAPFFDAARGGEPVHYTRVLPGPDGAMRTLSIRLCACLRDGRLLGFVLFGTDWNAQLSARETQRDATVRGLLTAERDRVAAELDEHIQQRLTAMLTRLDACGTKADRQALVERTVTDLDETIFEIRSAIGHLLEAVQPIADALPVVPKRAARDAWNPVLPSAGREPATSHWTMDEALAFIDALPGLTAWDTEQINCFANRLAVRGIGEDARGQMIGRSRAELFGPDVAALSQPYADAAVRGTLQRFDSHFVDGQGVTRTVHFVYHPVLRDARPIGMVAVLIAVEAAETAGSAAPIATLEDDRRRIAEDLHDHVIQHLYAAGLTLTGPADARLDSVTSLENASRCIEAAVDALRASVHALHADGAGDLSDSIAAALRRAEPALGFAPRMDLIGDLDRIAPRVATELLAVLTEALSNISRHAGARGVHITLSTGAGTVWLSVADDGCGIGSVTRSSGLSNLRNRAVRLGGTFDHHPNRPSGTILDWRVPQ